MASSHSPREALATDGLRAGAALAALVVAAAAQAQFPDRPLRLIVPFAPGGNIDLTARTIAPGMSQALGQPVVVDNRSGAGGRIGAEVAAKSAPDGYTLLLGSSGSLTINPVFGTNVSYDPLRDFTPTTLVSITPLVVTVHPSVPVKTIAGLIALAKKQPGRLAVASAGIGSTTHIANEIFQIEAGVKFIHVPFKGSGPALVDLVGGHADLMFDQLSTSSPHVRAGRLRALALTTSKRSALLPEIPTIEEAGVRGYEVETWTGVFLPANAPKEIVARIWKAAYDTLAQPSVREAFERLGSEPLRSTPEALALRMRNEMVKWTKVKQAVNIKLD
ncbi:MAG: tripartite tricarboxylate transporter substrate binding protein [Burkholderiales bacterium]|nr:tripartite tricarboxylate transporter substrate binding protein [Burkholderiales bacterium]